MEFKYSSNFNRLAKVVVLPLFEDKDFAATSPKEFSSLLAKRKSAKDFEAKRGESLLLTLEDSHLPAKIFLYGCGSTSKIDANKVRNLFASLAKALKVKFQDLEIFLPAQLSKFPQTVAEGLTFGNYNQAIYQTGKNKEKNDKNTLNSVTLVVQKPDAAFKKSIEQGKQIAETVCFVRNLVNSPPEKKTPDMLSTKSKQIAHDNGYKIKVVEKVEMQKLGMGGILGVNQGSSNPAKMVVMEYTPKSISKNPPVVLIGKGIIFDTGGIQLKPGSVIADMQLDMAGAAVVMGVFKLLKELGIKQNVVGIFPLTDNSIGPDAQHPSNIVTTYSGKTVEITFTDAEGRMVLCDALTYAQKHFKPSYIIDLATLTGAMMIALGEEHAGLFSNDKVLSDKLEKAGREVDELVWPLPISPRHLERMKSQLADLKNWDNVGNAGAAKAAAFLQDFIEEGTTWAHLDIAGTAFVKFPREYETPMATGYGVRLLIKFLQSLN